MRKHRLALCFTISITLFLLASLSPVQCQNYYVYELHIRNDGSALWTITQFSSASATVETWEGFQQKIFDLIDNASSVTQRSMDVDENSLQINTTISFESKTTEYSFVWQNFCMVQGSELSFGDVFQVHDFFNQLFGDAALELSYPENYVVKLVTPPPNERQDTANTMEWARTHDLVISTTNIILAPDNQMSNGENLNQYSYIILGVIGAIIGISLLGFYAFKKRKNNGKPSKTIITQPASIETDEDKVLKLLKNAGGTMKQSDITEACGFSKAKTSQLLTALENNGTLTRYKKGRDKIVTIKERVNGE